METEQKQIVFLAIPCGVGEINANTANSLIESTSSPRSVVTSFQGNSLLNFTFNILYCQALNLRKKMDLTRFVMLHSDIAPKRHTWLDDLLDIMDKQEADVVSVVVPIKDERGLSSVAVDTDEWRPRRLTMREIHSLPETFGQDDIGRNFDRATLLFNTGLMAIRLDRPWSLDVCFKSHDRIVQNDAGNFEAQAQPEDWTFSRWCAKQDLKCLVTRKVELTHYGRMGYANDSVWGQAVDLENAPELGLEATKIGEDAMKENEQGA